MRPNGEAFGWDIYINEEFRSQGIGRQIMLSVAPMLAEYNVHKIQICVLAGNLIARKLYASLGFKEIDFNETNKRYTLEADLKETLKKNS